MLMCFLWLRRLAGLEEDLISMCNLSWLCPRQNLLIPITVFLRRLDHEKVSMTLLFGSFIQPSRS